MAPARDQPSPFLRLPAELRNEMYTLALVADLPLLISSQQATSIKEPPLLKVNHQIRREAATVYYRENEFYLTIHSMDGASVLPFARLVARYADGSKSPFVQVTLVMMGGVDWKNLVAWLKLTHEGELLPFPSDDAEFLAKLPAGDAMRVTLHAHEMVNRLRQQEWWVV